MHMDFEKFLFRVNEMNLIFDRESKQMKKIK
jgi:hypothetical protein